MDLKVGICKHCKWEDRILQVCLSVGVETEKAGPLPSPPRTVQSAYRKKSNNTLLHHINCSTIIFRRLGLHSETYIRIR